MALVIFLLLLSVALNVVLVWYVRRLLREVAPLYERSAELVDSLEEFLAHAESVYELPLYYGDQTIKDLVEHTKNISNEAIRYKESFVFEDEGEIEFE